MKKFLALILALCMILALAACGQQAASPAPAATEAPAAAPAGNDSAPPPVDSAPAPAASGLTDADITKDLTIIIPSGAGGATDIAVRAFVEFFKDHWPTNVNVINIGGAGGSAAYNELKNYDNDGYVDKMTMVSDAAGVTRDVIFYLDSNSKLVAYSNGLFTQNFTTDNYGFEAVGSAGNAVSFEDGAGATPCYHIVCGSRYIYGAQPNGRLDAGGSAPAVGQTGYDWEIEEVTSLPVSVSTTVNYGTLYTPVALTVPAEGVEVYTGTIKGEYLHLNLVSGTIPAGTAVVLKYTDAVKTAGSLSFATAADVAEISGNVLAGQANTIAASGITNPYTLQNPATGIGFYPYNGTNLNGFKAYMTTGTSPVRGFLFEEDGTTTSIDTLETATPNAQTIYDLSGRRVSKAQKGLYIVNGKKVYIK